MGNGVGGGGGGGSFSYYIYFNTVPLVCIVNIYGYRFSIIRYIGY